VDSAKTEMIALWREMRDEGLSGKVIKEKEWVEDIPRLW